MRNIPNLGLVAQLLLRHAADEAFAYEDAAAFHAPSECLPLIRRGMLRQARLLRRRIRGLTGCNGREIVRRCAGRWLYMTGVGRAAQDVFFGERK